MANNVKKNLKKNRISKNKKRSWKNIDIADVEDFLEGERLQERTGGLAREKTDEQLFVVDKKKNLQVVEEDTSSPKKDNLKRRRREPKQLKCHANLLPDPNIKPARVKHNIRLDKLEKRPKAVVERIQSGKLTYTQIKAQQQRKKALIERKERRRSKRQLPTADYDLWGAEDTNKNEDPHYMVVTKKIRVNVCTAEDTNKNEDPHYMVVTKKIRVNVPKHYLKKPSEIAAVELPHPGASYNPAYDDHQELLGKAHNVEVKKVREEQKIYNAVDAKIPKTDWETIEDNWMNEMSVGLEDGDVEEETFTAEELERISLNPPVHRDNIKPEKQRKKEKSKKLEEKLKTKVAAVKERERDIYRLRSIKKEILQEEKRKKEKTLERQKRKAIENTETRKLGKMKFEEPCLEIKLSDEIEGSLRLLKPEGSLFEDRFKSLQKRNIIEPRLRAKKQKHYAPKYFEKKSHRNVPEVKLS